MTIQKSQNPTAIEGLAPVDATQAPEQPVKSLIQATASLTTAQRYALRYGEIHMLQQQALQMGTVPFRVFRGRKINTALRRDPAHVSVAANRTRLYPGFLSSTLSSGAAPVASSQATLRADGVVFAPNSQLRVRILGRVVLTANGTKTVALDATVKVSLTKTVAWDGVVQLTNATRRAAFTAAVKVNDRTKTVAWDGVVQLPLTRTVDCDAAVRLPDLTLPAAVDAALQIQSLTKTVALDAVVQFPSLTKTVAVDAAVRVADRLKTIVFDAVVARAVAQPATLDAVVALARTRALAFDALVSDAVQKTKTVAWDGVLAVVGTRAVSFDAFVMVP
jgi:hypothetical protein